MFSPSDIDQINSRGSSLAVVEKQVENFRTGFPYSDIVKAATVGDGIIRLDENEIQDLISFYEEEMGSRKTVKFVPASGAASRMFKSLFAFMNSYDNSDAAYNQMMADQGSKSMHQFFHKLKDFAFVQDLQAAYPDGKSLENASDDREFVDILRTLLTEAGLNYGSLPKGLLAFHRYDEQVRTPLQEHLVEGANYAKGNDGTVYLHFTVSPEHNEKFKTHLAAVKGEFEKEFGASYEVGFSEQKPSTDTIAVDMEDQPFRLADGKILFRPGGHGALIENLNDIDADVIFIKNVDNVVPDGIKDETYRFKKALAGVLLKYQARIFEYLQKIDNNDNSSEELVEELEKFLKEELCVIPDESTYPQDTAGKLAYFKDRLQRPLRVCGMVKNEGEPGGGPFWTRNSDGTVSLQIVESAQINSDDEDKKAIVQKATHFNPVDLICAPRNSEGKKFDLLEYRDPQTGFIAYKSKDGRELKAQELPGLWNGAMAYWNTIFVEVPIITFNPVKTVFDLLRKEHQAAS